MAGNQIHAECVTLDEAGLRDLARHLIYISRTHRRIIGIAGIGGSGKSTLALKLAERVEFMQPGAVRVVPMDGFHFRNARLDELGLRGTKGAPETYGADELIELLKAARKLEEQEGERSSHQGIDFPIYDRDRHEPVVTGKKVHQIHPETRAVLVEGNYLLLAETPWLELEEVMDECWWLEVPLALSRKWIIDRHIKGGRSAEDAAAFYEGADLLNAQRTIEHRRVPDLILRWPEHRQ